MSNQQDAKQLEKLVKVKILRDCYVTIDGKETLVKAARNPEQAPVVTITEKEAKSLCDIKFDTPPRHRGTRPDEDPSNKNYITRAVRV